MSHSSRVPFLFVFVLLLGTVLVAVRPTQQPARALYSANESVPDNCWTGTWEQYPRMGQMWLAQNGSSVSGNYAWDYGRLSGTLDGDTFRGEWSEWPTYAPPTDAGSFVFTIAADCASFSGLYNYGTEDEWQEWTGNRIEAPGRVSMTVEEPTVTYAGQEYAPGQTFFPEACDTSIRAAGAEPCETPITLERLLADDAVAALIGGCVYKRIQNVILIVEKAGLDELDRDLVLSIAASRALEKCLTSTERESAQLDLRLAEGAGLFANVAAGLALTVDAQQATISTVEMGSFLAGYDPDTGQTTAAAYSAPVTVTPLVGSPIVLPPYHQVTVTDVGPGPVTELDKIYLPALVAPTP